MPKEPKDNGARGKKKLTQAEKDAPMPALLGGLVAGAVRRLPASLHSVACSVRDLAVEPEIELNLHRALARL